MSMELDKLVKQVAETKAAEASMIALLDSIKLELESVIGELEEAKADTTTLVRLRDELDASEQTLLSAVKDSPTFSDDAPVEQKDVTASGTGTVEPGIVPPVEVEPAVADVRRRK